MQTTPKKNVTFIKRLRYTFDNTMSRGPAGLIIWLAIITVLLIAGVSLVVVLGGADPDKSVLDILWDIMYQTLTPNPVDPKAGSTLFLGGMLFSTVGSLFLVSIFIGILTNTIDGRIQNLRKGRSYVIEHGQTLILGWSPKIFAIISELVIANENRKNACIVILADKDKVEMEDEIRAKVKHLLNTRVVCRTGSPIDLSDLEIVNPQAARSIIVLSPEDDDPDSQVIKIILAITNHPDRRPEPYHIVAEIRNPRHMEIARMVGRAEVELVLASDLISRITVQTCRQSGLSVVYTELLNFEGDEIYFKQEPALVGKPFGDALMAYEDSTVIGLQFTDGSVKLNPPMETRIGSGDKLIAISEDDDTVNLSGLQDWHVNSAAIRDPQPTAPHPERTLILGWNAQACQVIAELDNYVAPGSTVTVMADMDEAETQTRCQGRAARNMEVSFQRGDTTDRATLENLNVPSYDHVIILCYDDQADIHKADAITLVTLLHLRAIAERSGHHFSIVSEMLDVRNRQLAEVTRADDFIVSDMLTSLMLAQVSENKYLSEIFADLFDAEGAEIYLKPASTYVAADERVNFYTVVESARRHGEVAIGYRLMTDANDAARAYGVVVNPDKSAQLTFGAQDRVIVLSES
jgi:voltage-gated potassium channel Kch